MARRKKDARPFWTIDCETDPFRHGRIPRPFIWGLYTGSGFHTFTDTADLVAEISAHDVIVYAHNGGKFDFHYLLDSINLHEKVTVINGRLVVAHIGACELRDSFNILPVALKQFGGKLDIDYAKLEPDVRHLHGPEIRRYLRMDCVDLWEKIDAFGRTYGRHLTLASAAMAQWVSISGRSRPHTDREYFKKFSQYYFGGRVQCFERGHCNGPLKVYDITSAYPWAMLEEHPYGPEYITLSNPNDFSPTSMVRVSCISRGALPLRNERGSMVFPDDNDAREYHVTGHELLAALETGTVEKVRVLEAIEFVNKVSFKQYIMKFFEERLQAKIDKNIAMDIFCKLLMNSLYGKFGANPDNYGNFMCISFDDLDEFTNHPDNLYIDDVGNVCKKFTFDGMIGNHALLRSALDDWQSHFINVATAASITGQVRAHLWRAICASDRPVYCDTDSIICGCATVPLGGHLGEWKHEGTANHVDIAGKKMYCCYMEDGSHKMATKGVRMTPAQISEAAAGREVLWKSEAPTFSLTGKVSVTQALREGLQGEDAKRFFKTRRINATG